MSLALNQARVIFLEAIEHDDRNQRAKFVAAACGDDVELRSRVERLLRSHEQLGSFHDGPSVTVTDRPLTESPGTIIGPYKLLEQIGEGGFGIVYMAEQSTPVRRKVALKILKPGMDTRQVVARFEAERQALAIMDHPHIAKVHDGGTTPSGRSYFVMELVKGVPLTDFCDQNRLTPRQRLELFIPVCQAVQHAHQKGIIHRDLKPSNVLVSRHDTTPIVKVIDFGVAKALGQELTDKTLFTGIAQMIGTPLYMSPEQAGMSDLDVDTRSDVYSLGVLLYELLTGTTPFSKERLKEAAYDEIRRIIREEEPPRPSVRISTLRNAETATKVHGPASRKPPLPAVLGELDWIVMKALEKDRNRRYESAGALARDIERHLRDEPVQACPPSSWYRFRKFARRNKSVLATASVVGLAILLALATLTASTLLISNALQRETSAKGDLAHTLERERREAYFQRITLAHHDLSADNLAGALRRLRECPEDLRAWEWHYLMRFCKVAPLIIRDTTELSGLAFSPDGEQLASAGGDGTVRIWNSRTGKAIKAFPAHTGAVNSVVFHRDGKHLASRGVDRTVKVWDLTATDQAVFTEPCDQAIIGAYTVALSPDGRLLAWGSEGVVKVWDWKNRQPLQKLPGHNFHTIAVAFSSDGRLATASFRGETSPDGNIRHRGVKVWDPETGVQLCAIDHNSRVGALAFTPDGKGLASANLRGPVVLWDSTTGTVRQTFDLHTGNVECVAISPDGRYLVSGGEDKTVRVCDAATGREILGLKGHTNKCFCVAFSLDGRRLASASSDGTIRIWDATPLEGDEHQEIQTLDHGDEVRTVAFSPDGHWIASAGDDYLVKVRDAQTGDVSVEFSLHKDDRFGGKVAVFGLAWHPGGRLIATSSLDTVRVWDAVTGREVFPLEPARGVRYQTVAFSPDGRDLVTGDEEGAVQVWDGGTGDNVGTLGIHRRPIRGLVFSRDGGQLASASLDGTVKIWDARLLDKQHLHGKPEPRIPPIRARVAGPGVNIAFSPDGRRLATGGEENTVMIRDVQTGGELQTLRGQHSGEVYTLAFSPDDDGRWVATAGEDSAVKVWDSHTGNFVHSFRGHEGLVGSLAFSPDGRRLVSGSRDTTVKIWDMTQLSDSERKP